LRREPAPNGELPSELSSFVPYSRSLIGLPPVLVTVKGKSLRDGLSATLDLHCTGGLAKTRSGRGDARVEQGDENDARSALTLSAPYKCHGTSLTSNDVSFSVNDVSFSVANGWKTDLRIHDHPFLSLYSVICDCNRQERSKAGRESQINEGCSRKSGT
jgi:hypothetical protein